MFSQNFDSNSRPLDPEAVAGREEKGVRTEDRYKILRNPFARRLHPEDAAPFGYKGETTSMRTKQ